MKVLLIVLIINSITFVGASFRNVTCGKDNSASNVVIEGVAKMETYPWLGYLIYTSGKKRFTTVVVLVTKQIVLGIATEIDKLPKLDFRSRARVVLGNGCSGPKLRIKDYTYHPEFSKSTYNALAMIQLDLEGVMLDDIRPICPPPSSLIDPEFYAMTLSQDCKRPQVGIYEMKYVDPGFCKTYYRKSGLDISSLWPTHTACAKAVRGGECVWRSGTALVVYQGRRWHLVGFGVYGPGCEAPSRFLDYGMYHQWVRQSILRIGRPTITRVGESQVILRRSLANLQRYGLCDRGEIKSELYTDHTSIKPDKKGLRRIRYNMTIYASIEYSCVVFRAKSFSWKDKKPKLRLRRWCAAPLDICSDYQYLEIDFYVEITFFGPTSFDLMVYGKKIQAIDTRRAMLYLNKKNPPPPIPDLWGIQEMVKNRRWPDWYADRNVDRKLLIWTKPPTSTTEGTSSWEMH